MPDIVVITNASSGTAEDKDVLRELDEIIRRKGLDARVDLCKEGKDLPKMALKAV